MSSKRTNNLIVLGASSMMLILLAKYVPRNRMREAHISFLFQQVITWFFGLLVVELGLIKYPYRIFFKKANKSSFVFEFFICPAITVLFNLYYPDRRSRFKKAIYIFAYSGSITFIEIFIEKYTDLIKYKKWAWYWSFITLSMTYYLSRLYYRWFTKVSAEQIIKEG
ncbi:CBO0543 family protein [Halalkalibacter krulwichiae]|uniref:Uncharacterized protein n=1 Tax=Halalkalibacter krulwichiae TaxID=199441 RepID=A0A1X9M8P0_9BACI|nr:CBO0543 family protein [Halalkalibacter krulwichiae]ARK29785.1 hypothetical protein BkAM31D_07885 [Halalkalibacter krulwichiae]